MATNSSSSIYGSSVNSGGIGGLMSGLDTDSLVEQMLSSTQAKINKQYQSQQKLVYQQDAYRSVISKLVGFSDKFFSYASKTNLLSPSFFKSSTFTSSSSNVNITGDASAIKNFVIDKIDEVATTSRFTSTNKVSNSTFNSDEILLSKDVSTLAGQSMSIKYGADTYTITFDKNFGGTTIQDAANEINKQLANTTLKDKIQYKVTGNKLELEDVAKTGVEIKIVAVGKGIENALNIKVNSSGTSDTDIDTTKFLENKTLADAFSKGEMTFDYNGVKKTFTFANSNITDINSLKNELQSQLDRAYGAGKITVQEEVVGGINTGKITFNAGTGNDTLSIASASDDIKLLTGLNAGTSNRVKIDVALSEAGMKTTPTLVGDKYELSVNGKLFSFDRNASINDIMNKINSDQEVGVNITYSRTTDTFTVASKETGAHTKVDIQDVNGGNLASALFGTKTERDSSGNVIKQGDYDVVQGTDAKLTVTMNGAQTEIVRSTNSFNIDGITVELTNKAKGEINISCNVTNNTDEVVKNIAQFIEDYNNIITYLDEKITETPNKGYPPLTDAQRKEMSESEIKLWEEKAKEGMLFCDSNMQAVLYDLRNAMSGFVNGTGLMLTDIGIKPAIGDYSGKLVFDEEKFRAAYAEKPDEIAKMFTQDVKGGTPEDQGLAVRVKSILSNNVGLSGEKGVLVDRSGTKGTTTANENYLSKRIKDYEETITKLKQKMEVERERYWKQFTALEKALATMNSQSSWLSSQFQ